MLFNKPVAFLAVLFLLSQTLLAATDPTVATINNRVIKLDEFNKRFDDAKKLMNPPNSKKAFLEDLVRYEIGVQEAEKKNIAKDPIVAERIRQQLYVGLIEKDLGDKISAIQISESEMRDYYKTSPEIKSSHILIEMKPGATEAERNIAKNRANEILSEVKSSKRPFEELVNLYSDDVATKKQGGDIGYQSRVTIIGPYYEALNKLSVGEISGLIETRYGFHIAKLTGRHPYDEAKKELLRNAILEKKRLALFNEYFDKLKKKYKVSSNLEVLK